MHLILVMKIYSFFFLDIIENLIVYFSSSKEVDKKPEMPSRIFPPKKKLGFSLYNKIYHIFIINLIWERKKISFPYKG